MNKRTRSRLEMGRRALEFSDTHQDPSTGYTAAVQELKELLARSQQLTDLHRQGIAQVRSATTQKRKLRHLLRQGELYHVARAAQRAAREVPELAETFALDPEPIPYLQFQSLARSVAAEAEGRKELLVKHGLVDRMLVSLGEGLAQFDQAMTRGAEGRRTHVAASVELDVIGADVLEVVKVIDSVNRVRFAGDPDLLAAWKSASNVIGPSRPAQKTEPDTEAPTSGAPAA